MISIGAVYSGPELRGSHADRTIKALRTILFELVGSFEVGGASPGVNVVFCVPGSLGGPDWEWLREAKFSRQKKLILVQVAVPVELVNSSELKEFVVRSLHGANAIAFDTFDEKGLKFPLREAEELVRQIKDRLASFPDPQPSA